MHSLKNKGGVGRLVDGIKFYWLWLWLFIQLTQNNDSHKWVGSKQKFCHKAGYFVISHYVEVDHIDQTKKTPIQTL